jgi:hypothetical protein
MDLVLDPMTDNTDSPDIGPPPVSNFINEDPVKIDLPNRNEATNEDSPEIDPTRSINLEQRRKRKDSTEQQTQRRPSRFEPGPSHSGREVAQSLKTGAKRKLSTRDDEDGPTSAKAMETSPDDFKYTRRNTEDQSSSKALAASENPAAKAPREIAVAKGTARERTTSSVLTNSRKALGPKTTNTDLANSPRKTAKPPLFEESSSNKRDPAKKDLLRERVRERRSEVVPSKQFVEPDLADVNIEQEPETPAALDLFSPPESGSSAIRPESRDTPPPPDLGQGAEGLRPSRRARGSVSYAEPNLRDKMRRPTKELVDAVTGEGKTQRLSMVKLENDAPTTATKIKEEAGSSDDWKKMPSASAANVYSKSPLVDRVASREPAAEVITSERQRRRASLNLSTGVEPPRSGSSSAISALLVGSRKTKQESKEQVKPKDALEDAMAKLDIYDFTGSSPRQASDSRIPASKGDAQTSMTSRRLPSTMQDLTSASTADISDGESNHRSASVSSRRRQSMMGPGTSTSMSDTESGKLADRVRRSNSQSTLSESIESNSRSERVSARRRSMML